MKSWNLKGEPLTRAVLFHTKGIYGLAFSPDHTYILTGSQQEVKLWKHEEEPPFHTTLGEGQEGFTRAFFSPNGESLVSSSLKQHLKLWDRSGNLLGDFGGSDISYKNVSYSKDGKYILSLDQNKNIQLWDQSGDKVWERPNVREYVFSRKDSFIYAVVDKNLFQKINLKGQVIEENDLLKDIQGGLRIVDGTYLIFNTSSDRLHLCDLDFNPIGSLAIDLPKLTSFQIRSDKYVAASFREGKVKTYTLKGETIAEWENDTGREIKMEVSPNGEFILTSTYLANNELWKVDGSFVAELTGMKILSSSTKFKLAKFSPNNQYILAEVGFENNSEGYDLILFNTKGERIATLVGLKSTIISFDFTPDNRAVIASSIDGSVKMWNLKGELLTDLKGHKDWVFQPSFSPDGKYMATPSKDGTIRIWPLPSTIFEWLQSEDCGIPPLIEGELIKYDLK